MTTQGLMRTRDTLRQAIRQIEEILVDRAADRQRVEIAREQATAIERRFFVPSAGRCLPQRNANAGVVQAFPKGRW